MKKNVITIILAIIVLMEIIPISKADDGKGTTINITTSKQTVKEEETIEVKISLGAFNGIQENSILAISGDLTYNSAMFEIVEQEGLNGWTLTTGTDKFALDTSSAKQNTDVARFVFKTKDELKNGVEGNIDFKNVVLSDGDSYLIVDGKNSTTLNKNFTVAYTGATTIKNSTENDQTKTDTQNLVTPSDSGTTSTTNTNAGTTNTTSQGSSSSVSQNKPINTVSKNTTSTATNTTGATNALTRLPSAGRDRLIIVLVVLAALAVIFRIKSRKIKY